MPDVLADYGSTVLVRFPDGTQQEMIKESYERAFPGGQYPGQTMPLGASQASAPPLPSPAAPVPPAPSSLLTPADEPEVPLVDEPAQPLPQPTGAFSATGAPPAPATLGVEPLTPPTAEPPRRGPPPLHSTERGTSFQTLPQYALGTREYGSARIGAAQDLGDIESQELAQVAGILDDHDTRARTIEVDQMRAHEEGLKAAEKRAGEIDALAKEYKDTRIDRGRLFTNMSTGNKVLAAIGLGLSAIGQAKSGQGGVNPALQIILGAVEDDVQAQIVNLEAKGRAVEQQRGLYREMLERLGNKTAAYDMTMAMSAAQAKRQVEIIGAQSQSQKVKLQAQDLSAQLGQYVADKEEYIRRAAADEEYRLWQMRMAQLKASGAGKKPDPGSTGPQGVWTKGEGGALAMDIGPGSKVYDQIGYFGDQPFLAGTPKEAEEVTNSYAQTQSAINNLSNLRANADKLGFADGLEVLKSDIAKMAGVDEVFALMEMKDAFGLGVLSGPDEVLLRKLTAGEKAKWGDIKKLLKRSEQNMEQRFIERARAKGYKGPVKFNRAESPPPPPTWDKSAKNVMDARLSKQDRLGAIDRMIAGVKREKMALDQPQRFYAEVVDTVKGELDQKKQELDALVEEHGSAAGPGQASVVGQDLIDRARAEYNTANSVYQRLLKEQDRASEKALKQEAREAKKAEHGHTLRGLGLGN